MAAQTKWLRGGSISRVGGSVLVSAAAAATLAGCGSSRPNLCQLSDTSPLVVEASDRLNPDANGRSLPTIVRLYQLRDVGALEQASFQEVWRTPEEALGESLISVDELTIYPDQTIRRGLDRDPDANYLVGMGIFRTPVGSTWRSVLTLPAPRSESQCAAAQGQADGEAAVPPVAHVTFFMEDNRIEGELELAPVTSGGCDPSNPFCAAAEQAAPEAPEAPAAPEAPSAPGAPAPGKHAAEAR
jgi:type VI secretion system protein VasD